MVKLERQGEKVLEDVERSNTFSQKRGFQMLHSSFYKVYLGPFSSGNEL